MFRSLRLLQNPFAAAIAFICFDFSPSFADPIEGANNYGVRIKSSISNSFFHDGGSGTSNGAGFLVDKERGWIITNARVSGYRNADLEA